MLIFWMYSTLHVDKKVIWIIQAFLDCNHSSRSPKVQCLWHFDYSEILAVVSNEWRDHIVGVFADDRVGLLDDPWECTMALLLWSVFHVARWMVP